MSAHARRIGDARNPDARETPVRRRALLAACSAHAVHDGLTDMVHVPLPIWQTHFSELCAGG